MIAILSRPSLLLYLFSSTLLCIQSVHSFSSQMVPLHSCLLLFFALPLRTASLHEPSSLFSLLAVSQILLALTPILFPDTHSPRTLSSQQLLTHASHTLFACTHIPPTPLLPHIPCTHIHSLSPLTLLALSPHITPSLHSLSCICTHSPRTHSPAFILILHLPCNHSCIHPHSPRTHSPHTHSPRTHSPACILMMEIPVSVSPLSMVWSIGAAPRHRGSTLGWTFKIPLEQHIVIVGHNRSDRLINMFLRC